MITRTLRLALLVTALLPIALPHAARAQSVRTATLPDTITVGDVARAAVRVTVPRNAVVTFPDSLVLPAELENAGDRTITIDTSATGLEITAEYAVAGWRPGAHALPVVPFTIDGVTYAATFDSMRIQSVLPADTTGIKPKPLKAVLGGTRVWWPILALLLALLVVAAIAYVIWRRRANRIVELPAAPRRPARDLALDRLQRARDAGLVERGDMKQFYSEMSDALREYVAAVDASLTTDLTTTELTLATRRRGATAAAVDLVTLLRSADMVKFARRVPDPAEAYDVWARARAWVSDVTWPPVPREQTERAA
jgi:hypothetical protein